MRAGVSPREPDQRTRAQVCPTHDPWEDSLVQHNGATGPFLKPAALAERHHTTTGHLANLRSRGEGVPFIKLGARVLYPLAAVEAFEAAHLVQTVGAA